MTKSSKSSTGGMSEQTKTIVIILSLVFVSPVGILLVWLWTKWKMWVKLLITVPLFLIWLSFFGIFFIGLLGALNPSGALQMGQCKAQCKTAVDEQACMRDCYGGAMMDNDYSR